MKILVRYTCAMLTAYFDDSGTHDASDVVLLAGLFGTEARMDCLDRNWKKQLADPVSGYKPAVSRFHAYDCNNLVNEFQSWSRTEADYFCAQLRKIIIEADVAAYGIACSRKDYDALITGEYRWILGPTAEAMCINQCFVRTLAWVQANTFDPNVGFVFDNRPSPVRRYAGTVCNAFELWLQPPPVLRGYAFQSSLAVRPLQAADLIAWEMYQHANDCLRYGIAPPRREEFKELGKNMDFTAQFASPESIMKMRDFWDEQFRGKSDLLDQMAKHFKEFDPEKPDYSHLVDNRPQNSA